METLAMAAVILTIAYRLIRCIIGALFATGAVLLIISIGWGIYDRIMGGRDEKET